MTLSSGFASNVATEDISTEVFQKNRIYVLIKIITMGILSTKSPKILV